MKKLLLLDPEQPTPRYCCYFGVLPDGRGFQAVPSQTKGKLVVVGVGIGYTHDEEGAKVIWQAIPPEKRWEIPGL